MTLTDLIDRAGCSVVVDLVDDDGPHPSSHDGLRVVDSLAALPSPEDETRADERVGAVVHTPPESLATALADDTLAAVDVVVVALAGDTATLDPATITADVATAGLAVEHAVSLAYSSVGTGLVLAARDDIDGDRPADGTAAVADLVVTALRRQLADARAAADAAADLRDELDRRATRIATLHEEVATLRDRLTAEQRRSERELATRDRSVGRLRQEVQALESSVSYRLGHGLVRLVRDPRLLLRVPGALLRLVRARLGGR